MTGLINRLSDLEGRFERLRLENQDLQRKLTQALQQIRDGQSRYYPPPGYGGATVWHIPAASAPVIAAGGSGTADVWQTIGGTSSLMVSGATIYNVMGAATVASKVIMVGACGDGTFKVISQSCT